MKLQIVNDSVVKLGEISFTRNEYVPIFKNVKYDADGNFQNITADSALQIKRKFDGEIVFSVSLEETDFYDSSNTLYTDYEVLLSDLVYSFSNLANVQGQQGPIGPQGVPGPVGPAGLNWQGPWVSGTSYVEDDAVGYDGASWFCILATNGTTTPDVDTTHWALLASQGATGPQGPQGEQGPQGPAGPAGASGSVTKTAGLVFGTSYLSPAPLTFDINTIKLGAGSGAYFMLPSGLTNSSIGKEIKVISDNSNTSYINSDGNNNQYILTTSTSYTTQVQIEFNQIMVFTYVGNGYWTLSGESRYPITLAGRTLGNGVVNNYALCVINTLYSTPPTAAQLNQTYSHFFNLVGLKVVCAAISGGPIMYIKTSTSGWVSVPVSVVS